MELPEVQLTYIGVAPFIYITNITGGGWARAGLPIMQPQRPGWVRGQAWPGCGGGGPWRAAHAALTPTHATKLTALPRAHNL